METDTDSCLKLMKLGQVPQNMTSSLRYDDVIRMVIGILLEAAKPKSPNPYSMIESKISEKIKIILLDIF